MVLDIFTWLARKLRVHQGNREGSDTGSRWPNTNACDLLKSGPASVAGRILRACVGCETLFGGLVRNSQFRTE